MLAFSLRFARCVESRSSSDVSVCLSAAIYIHSVDLYMVFCVLCWWNAVRLSNWQTIHMHIWFQRALTRDDIGTYYIYLVWYMFVCVCVFVQKQHRRPKYTHREHSRSERRFNSNKKTLNTLLKCWDFRYISEWSGPSIVNKWKRKKNGSKKTEFG